LDNFSNIVARINNILNNESRSFNDSLNEICKLLKEEFSNFDWVGFYFANPKKQVLVLEAYSGKPTDHTVIPFGKGICGQVAISNTNFIVPDVSEQQNYISCDINVKSEIVIPILLDGNNVGQIDIDSNSINSFNIKDIKLLEAVCKQVSIKMKKSKISIYEFN